MIDVHFNETEQILYVHIDGVTSLDELARASKENLAGRNMPERLRVIEFADAEIERANVPDIYKLGIDFITAVWSRFTTIQHAVVTDNPMVVAYVMLLKESSPAPNYMINIFSTEQAAKQWLLDGHLS